MVMYSFLYLPPHSASDGGFRNSYAVQAMTLQYERSASRVESALAQYSAHAQQTYRRSSQPIC